MLSWKKIYSFLILFLQTRVLQDALERRTSNNQSPILSPSPTPSTGSNRTNSLPRQSTYANSDPRRASQQSIQNSNTSPFTPVPSKKYAGSPGSTLNRQKNNIGTSSDLGSSVGDEFQAADFSETLVSLIEINSRLSTRILRPNTPKVVSNTPLINPGKECLNRAWRLAFCVSHHKQIFSNTIGSKFDIFWYHLKCCKEKQRDHLSSY